MEWDYKSILSKGKITTEYILNNNKTIHWLNQQIFRKVHSCLKSANLKNFLEDDLEVYSKWPKYFDRARVARISS